MIGILDEALRQRKARPYLEMPDYMMDSFWVTETSAQQTHCPYKADPFHKLYFHGERETG